jgi:hypothetical protein
MNTLLYDRMETFILSEVDYAVENGFSRRARGFMRRKLRKELKEVEELNQMNNEMNSLMNEENSNTNSDSDDEPFDFYIKMDRSTYLCLSFIYIGGLMTFYLWFSHKLFTFVENNTNTNTITLTNQTYVGQTYSNGIPYVQNYSDCLTNYNSNSNSYNN